MPQAFQQNLMGLVGSVHPPEGNPDNVFNVASLVPGEQSDGPVSETGCKMTPPPA
ncbi:MAG: hypothetical protein ABSF34_17320 [Verrucomicrobiota bacterium]